jgi:hypothetical protein
MAFSTVFQLMLLICVYRLGVHNTRHPGDLTERIRELWKWMNQ